MRCRRGVTLIELLVVIAIITALATLIVAVAPRFGERQRATRGAAQLQTWLNLAKQRAMRDQRPVGIRLPVQDGTVNPTYFYVRELQYVELPAEGVGGVVTVPFPVQQNATPDYRFIAFTTPIQFTPNDPRLQNNPPALIQYGDLITFPDRPMAAYAPRRITSSPAVLNASPPSSVPDDSVVLVSSNTTVNPPQYTYRIQLDQALPATPFTTQSHVFVRRARPVVGEPTLQLPQDIAIDISQDRSGNLAWYRLYPPANSGGPNPFDIVFAPTGKVVGFAGVSRISLWVRDVSMNTTGPNVGNDPNMTDPTQLPPGENTLITVYTRTGHISSHPIEPGGLILNSQTNPNAWNPFKFTQDGLTSGQ